MGCITRRLPTFGVSYSCGLVGGTDGPALARRCRNKPAAHKYTAQGFPGCFKEMIQPVPRGLCLPPFPPCCSWQQSLWRSVPACRDGAGDAWRGDNSRGQGAGTCCLLHTPPTLSVLPGEWWCPLRCGDTVLPGPGQLATSEETPRKLPQTPDVSPALPPLPCPTETTWLCQTCRLA